MGKALDFVHENKRWLGFALAGLALVLRQYGHHDFADWILAGGTIAGVGYLPKGPNAPEVVPQNEAK